MAFKPSLRKQLNGVIPTPQTTPTADVHMEGIVNGLEARMVFTAETVAAASDPTTGFSPFAEGMLLKTTVAPKALYTYEAGAWVLIWPTNRTGDLAPANSLGVNGDTYDEY